MTSGNVSNSFRISSVGGMDGPAQLQLKEELFETPSDLVCPITHELFRDPVLTRLGQVYERAAIEQHIAMHAKMHGQQAGRPSSSGSTSHPTPSPSQPMDPVTNSPLPDVSLTPVYPMRSRAMAYRESRARACAARACMPGTDAVRYLRRAAELAAGAAEELRIAGLSQEVCDYITSHASPAYDHLCLLQYADTLRAAGCTAQATTVYQGALLRPGADVSRQAAALQRCVECWGPLEDCQLVARLAGVLESSTSCSAGQFVDVMLAASLPEHLVLRFCEHALASTAAAGAGPNSNGQGDGSSGAGQAAAAARNSTQLLLRYTQLRCERAECQAAEALALAATQASSSGSGKTCKQHAAVHADGQQAGAAAIASSSAGSSRRLALPAGWRQRMRVAASGLLGALIVGSRNGQVGRSLQAASLLFLLHSSRQR